MKLHLSLFASLIFTALPVNAQSETDVRVSQGGYGLVKTNVTVSYDHTWGRVADGFNARVSYEFVKHRFVTLSGNLKYSSVSTDFRPADFDRQYNPGDIDINGTHVMGQIGMTATAYALVAGQPVMGLGMINSEWGKGGFNRLSAAVMGILMLKADRMTQFGVGLMGMVNTTSKMPVFPVFVYRHRFNDRWLLNLYGSLLGFDYFPGRDDVISIGADVDVKSFYFRPHSEGLPETCRYTQTNFRPMLKYRHRLVRDLYFDAQAGYAINMRTRVNGVNGTREYIVISQKPHPFVQASFSYSL